MNFQKNNKILEKNQPSATMKTIRPAHRGNAEIIMSYIQKHRGPL